MKILVSACLLGEKVRYDGKDSLSQKVLSLKDRYNLIPFCPEVEGGLPIPRIPCEQRRDQVVGKDGQDYTEAFQKGAQKTLDLCNKEGIQWAILKSRSPSCGYGSVYDGSFIGKKTFGHGVTARLLAENGIKVFTDEDFPF